MKNPIPIIALTADVTTADVAKCKKVGMNDYISKPVDERLLYSKLIGIIKKPLIIIEEKSDSDGVNKMMNLKYVDISYLLKLTKSNPEMMTEMINVYLRQTPPLVETMKQSYYDKDWKLLQATIHKIIPSFAIVGMIPETAMLAEKIQLCALNLERSEDLLNLIHQLEVMCKHSFVELEHELSKIKN
jgi:CheY-like chemotaxis protein